MVTRSDSTARSFAGAGLTFADLLLQPVNLLAQTGNAAGNRYLIAEEDSPYSDPSGKQEMKIFHIESFAEDATKAD